MTKSSRNAVQADGILDRSVATHDQRRRVGPVVHSHSSDAEVNGL